MTRAKEISKLITGTTVTDLTVGSSEPDLIIQDTDGTNQFMKIQQVGGASMIKTRSGSNDGEFYITGEVTGTNKMKISTSGQAYLYGSLDVTGGLTTTTASSIEGGVVFNEASADVDFRVESNGNTHAIMVQAGSDCIGIKTASPNDYYADDFVVTADNQGGITIVGGTSDTGQYLAFADGNSGSNRFRGYLQYAHDTDNMLFATNASERMRIDSSGNVGIGMTPNTNYTKELNILGSSTNARIKIANSSTGSSNTDGFDLIADGNGAYVWNRENDILAFATNNNEQMRLTSGGDLLVNTSTDTSGGFSVQTISNNTTSTRMLAHGFSVRNNWGSATNLGEGIFSPAGSTLGFSTASTERMRIDSSGNVGIGTTPEARLDIRGITGASSNAFLIGYGTDGHNYYTSGASGIHVFRAYSSERMRIDSSGKVGINISNPGNYDDGADRLVVGDASGRSGITIRSSNSTAGSIHFADGTSAADSYRGILAYNHDDNSMRFFTNGASERMRIDTSGKIGMGQSTPVRKLHIKDTSADMYIGLEGGTSNKVGILMGDTDNHTLSRIRHDNSDNSLQFHTNETERMRIHSNGNVSMQNTDNQALLKIYGHLQSYNGLMIQNGTNNSGGLFVSFRKYDNITIGSISQNNSAVSFNTSSDYRLKESITYNFDATTRLKQLKPARFNWISDDTNTLQDGFLAHEVSSIVPEAITGTKDDTQNIGTVKDKDGNIIDTNISEAQYAEGKKETVDSDGNKKESLYPSTHTWEKTGSENVYQQIDHSKLVPLLVKTIQELEARITALESA